MGILDELYNTTSENKGNNNGSGSGSKHLVGLFDSYIQARDLFRTGETQYQQTTKAIMIEIAETIEKLVVDAGMTEFMMSSICSTIIKELQKRGCTINETDYVRRVLPTKYKFESFLKSTTEKSSIQVQNISGVHAEEISIETDRYNEALLIIQSTNKYALPARTFQESFDTIADIKQSYFPVANNRKIALLDNEPGSPYHSSDTFQGIPDKFQEVEHIKKAEPKITDYYEALVLLAKTISKYAEKVKQYPPANAAESAKWAKSVHTFIKFFDPTIDDKWRRSWLGWAYIIRDKFDYGKHGSASKTATAGLELRKNKKGEEVPGIRKLTREQIGDKEKVMLEYATEIYEHFMIFFDSCRWYLLDSQARKTDLSISLHDKLSERS